MFKIDDLCVKRQKYHGRQHAKEEFRSVRGIFKVTFPKVRKIFHQFLDEDKCLLLFTRFIKLCGTKE